MGLLNGCHSLGSVAGFYHWSRGVQIRANLDLLMDWIQSIGLGDLSTKHFQTLSAAVNLLATPKETLLQVRKRPLPPCQSSVVSKMNYELFTHNVNVGRRLAFDGEITGS